MEGVIYDYCSGRFYINMKTITTSQDVTWSGKHICAELVDQSHQNLNVQHKGVHSTKVQRGYYDNCERYGGRHRI